MAHEPEGPEPCPHTPEPAAEKAPEASPDAVSGAVPEKAPGRADDFDALVASWQAEGTVPRWPGGADDGAVPPAPAGPPEIDPRLDPEEHYVPPEPPPLPKLGAAVGVGLVLVAIGIILIAAPSWIGTSSVYGLPLGLVAIAAGITWLLMRLWQPASTDGEPDDDGTL
ncbi:hypothetical protein GCM10009836_14800 [Pseudonocardia ailaonensis]|uniref:DUF308 domain-containing protein n=1 Tax=Pseudonocardia ailaonensis TaxID=367279 RepID=A0ABN2MSH0_9PSEU